MTNTMMTMNSSRSRFGIPVVSAGIVALGMVIVPLMLPSWAAAQDGDMARCAQPMRGHALPTMRAADSLQSDAERDDQRLALADSVQREANADKPQRAMHFVAHRWARRTNADGQCCRTLDFSLPDCVHDSYVLVDEATDGAFAPRRQRARGADVAPAMVFAAFLQERQETRTTQDPPRQDQNQNQDQSQSQDQGQQQDQRTRPPSLDDLLGLDEPQVDRAREVAEQQQQDALQDRLSETPMSDSLERAVNQMQLSAELLDEQFDPGIATQRVQEEIIAGLEMLIDQAEANAQNMSAASSMTRQQQQQRNPGRQQQQQEQQPGDGQQDQQDQATGEPGEGDPPGRREGDINRMIEESRTEWGNLPARVREELLQGRQEKFSSLYDRLTREYYRRLAEDSSSR